MGGRCWTECRILFEEVVDTAVGDARQDGWGYRIDDGNAVRGWT